EPCGGGGERHQPEGCLGARDEERESDRGDEQEDGAHDGPVPPAELGHGERVGKAHERAHESRQCHELEQLVGRVGETRLRKLGRDDAPEQPDRESQVLREDRPEEVAPRDELPFPLPELLVLRVPVADPGRCWLGHPSWPLSRGWLRRQLLHAGRNTSCSTPGCTAGSPSARSTTSPITMIAGAVKWAARSAMAPRLPVTRSCHRALPPA